MRKAGVAHHSRRAGHGERHPPLRAGLPNGHAIPLHSHHPAGVRVCARRRTRQGEVGLHHLDEDQRPDRRPIRCAARSRAAGRADARGTGLESLGRAGVVASLQLGLPPQPNPRRGAVGVLRRLRRGRDHRLPLPCGGRHSIRHRHGNQRPGGNHPSLERAIPHADLPLRQRCARCITWSIGGR